MWVANRPDIQCPQALGGSGHPGALTVPGSMTMRAPTSHQNRLRRCIACLHFSEDDVNALRSLLGLLDPYLKQEWEVAAPERAHLVLARVDNADDGIDAFGGTPVIACVRRPRQLDAPAIHRPLRASEILTVLNEYGETAADVAASPSPSPAQAGKGAARAWRLGFWPLEFETLPPAWRQVMAALSARSMTREQLALCTGIEGSEIDRCMQALKACNALMESSSTVPPRDPPPAGWRHFITGIGRKLGFTA